jgi:sulfofructose kinase
MTQPSPRIAGAGICCLDHLVTAPQVPWGGSAHVSGYLAQGGGLVATALVACARLGARCDLLSLVGTDPIGDQILDELRDEGVSVVGVARVSGAGSPFSFILVDERSGERTIFHRPGDGLQWTGQEDDLAGVAECDVLLVDHVYPALSLAAARVARRHGVPVVADVVPSRVDDDFLREVQVLIAPRDFASAAALEHDLDAALNAIHALGPPTAVITLGAEGWVASDAAGRHRGDAYRVPVVDTTGAGDVFHGAFAYGLARGWDIARCADFAAAVAALKCTRPGGRTGLPTLPQALEFLRAHSALDWA